MILPQLSHHRTYGSVSGGSQVNYKSQATMSGDKLNRPFCLKYDG